MTSISQAQVNIYKGLVEKALTFVSIEPTKSSGFGYRVTFDINVREVSGRVSTTVSFGHGKRERPPRLDEIVAKAKTGVVSDLSVFGKAN